MKSDEKIKKGSEDKYLFQVTLYQMLSLTTDTQNENMTFLVDTLVLIATKAVKIGIIF